jgi:hypothetical protein
MYNKLTWTNPNGATPITVNIYRGSAPLDRNNLTSPIVSLTAGETTYTDNTAVRGQTYYYVFETISASDRTVSQNYAITVVPRRGAGPNVLQVGDYNYGYFGSIVSASFINATALRTAVNFALGTVVNAAPKWHKYARNGKVIYVPETPLVSNTISWKQLYDAGLVFGTGDNGPYNAGANVLQNAQVTIGPDTYRVRLMRGYNDDYNVFPASATVAEPVETFTCEWDDFVYPLCSLVPTAQRMANRASLTTGQLVGVGGYTVAVQEKVTNAGNTIALYRGVSSAARTGIAQRSSVSYSTATLAWWPVLELIEPAVV